MHRHYGTEVRGLGYPRRSASGHYTARDPSGPLALAEYGDAPAVGVNAVNVGWIRADHPVDMDQAIVAALSCNLPGRNFGIAGYAFFRGGGAAYLFIALFVPDREIHARSGVMQLAEALPIQPFGP